jgi:hypothetical protein
MPSAKYSFSWLSLKFSNGRTAMLFSGGAAAAGAGALGTSGRRAFASSTSSVRLIPSGVSSKAQASSSATGKPSARRTTTNRTAQVGISKNGKVCVAIWISSQLRTA